MQEIVLWFILLCLQNNLFREMEMSFVAKEMDISLVRRLTVDEIKERIINISSVSDSGADLS